MFSDSPGSSGRAALKSAALNVILGREASEMQRWLTPLYQAFVAASCLTCLLLSVLFISSNPRSHFVCQVAPLFQQALSQRSASDKEPHRLSA